MIGGLQRALKKRPVSADAIELAISTIKSKLRATGEREVPSKLIGNLVMEQLIVMDKVAYIRFASVYRSFEDVREFGEEIAKPQDKPIGLTESDYAYVYLFDHQMMSRAIELARRGRFTTSPNPNVGCAITRGEQIVGKVSIFVRANPMLKCMRCAKPVSVPAVRPLMSL